MNASIFQQAWPLKSFEMLSCSGEKYMRNMNTLYDFASRARRLSYHPDRFYLDNFLQL